MADRLDVLLGILLDKAAQKDTERGLSAIEKQIESLDDAQLSKLSFELEAISAYGDEIEQKFASAREEAARLSQTSAEIGRLGRSLSVAGAAIVGGIALTANQYVSFVEKAGIKGDETAERWIAASKRVQNAQLNLGETAAQAILPIYEKAAQLAEKAAAFEKENPELVQAALNTGLVVATLGAVGIAVSKGIKLYADIKYLAATAEYSLATTRFQNAVREYLTGTLLPKGGAGAAGLGGTVAGAARTVGQVTLVASAVIIGAEAGVALGNALSKKVYGEGYQPQNIKDAALTASRLTQVPLALLATQLEKMGGKAGEAGQSLASLLSRLDEWRQRVLGMDSAAKDAEKATDDLSTGIRNFQDEATKVQATNAYIQYRQQEAQAEENYMAQRAQIVEQGARQIAQIEANYAEQRSRLIEGYAASSAQAVSNFQFQQKQAAEQFARSEASAVKTFNEQRAKQVEQYQREEEKARKDHLREMRKLEEDHQDRVRDLVASRDALGLSREKRDYERKKRDAEEEYRTDRQRRRQDFQRQQNDREKEFQADRARRREEFAFRQQQAAEQFAYQQAQAKAQFEERLKQLEEEHKIQLTQTRRQTAERLRELELQYRQEQITRRNAFYDILRDLDANLLNERNIRVQYYAQMQKDLVNFLQSTAGKTGSNLPGYPTETHQAGGYGPGYVGSGEFVVNRSTTKRLEGLVGGRLTQRNVQGAVRSNTVNIEFPGGLITAKMAGDMMDKKISELLGSITRGIV